MVNEELIKLFKQKYNLTEEQSSEIISIVKANVNNRLGSDCIGGINIADRMNAKYAGKIVYFNQYEAGGWICNCQRVVYDINMNCIRFEGSRFILLTENGDVGGYGYAFVRAYDDDGAEYQFDEDFEDELEILNGIDDVKEIIENINEITLDKF
jgi:hypothetical protein